MTNIIEAINEHTADYLSDYNLKNYGFCELMRKSAGEGSVEQPFPVSIPDRNKAVIDDRYQICTWIRLVNPVQYEANEEWSFGKNEAKSATMSLRMVFASKTTLGENLVYEFIHDFPSKLLVPDYKFVFVNATPSVDPDHETVYETELGKTAYEKHRFTWNVYAITLNVQFIICEGNYRILENGDYRELEDETLRILE